MSRYGYLEVFQRVPWTEITRVDFIENIVVFFCCCFVVVVVVFKDSYSICTLCK